MFSDLIINLASEILDRCRAEKLQIATAESCTGGLIIGALTEIAGSSDVVDRGFITYTNQAKMDLLSVSTETLKTYGAVSEETARAMVLGALNHSTADIAVSVTGIAGPGGGSKEKPVGLVHMAAARLDEKTIHEKHNFGDIGRQEVREATIIAALTLIKKLI
ncbi:MAG: CinA family protein [Emcibacteraceae bacterium]